MRQYKVCVSAALLGCFTGLCGAATIISLSAQRAAAIDQSNLPELKQDKTFIEPSVPLAPLLEEETLEEETLENESLEQPQAEDAAKGEDAAKEEDATKEGSAAKEEETTESSPEILATPSTPTPALACLGGICQPAGDRGLAHYFKVLDKLKTGQGGPEPLPSLGDASQSREDLYHLSNVRNATLFTLIRGLEPPLVNNQSVIIFSDFKDGFEID